jgi:hypothetical protein
MLDQTQPCNPDKVNYHRHAIIALHIIYAVLLFISPFFIYDNGYSGRQREITFTWLYIAQCLIITDLTILLIYFIRFITKTKITYADIYYCYYGPILPCVAGIISYLIKGPMII